MAVMHTGLGAMVLAEHAAFRRTIETLRAADWDRPSWCRDWSVRDVVIHVAGHVHHSVPLSRRLADLAGSGLRPSIASTREVRRHSGASEESLLRWLSEPLDDGIDGTDALVQLAELAIHGEDIRRPLGFAQSTEPETVRTLLDHGLTRLGSVAVAGARRRAKGLQLHASDLGWGHGKGPLVRGPAMSLLLALNGRRAALTELDGAGVAVLGTRMPTGG